MLITSLLIKLIDYLFPNYCLGCNDIDQSICDQCLEKITIYENTHEPTEKFLDDLLIGYIYEKQGILAEALHNWKYEGGADFGMPLKKLMRRFWKRLWECKSEWKDKIGQGDLKISYIPLNEQKFRQREFNQCRELADCSDQKDKVIELLVKVGRGPAQMTLKGADRFKNIQNSFQILAGPQLPAEVILVDDVYTTGATLNEAARVLKTAGVKKVYGIALARQRQDNLAKKS